MKILCKKCHVEKDADQFYAHPFGKHGRDSKCKECAKLYARERRKDPAASAVICARDRARRKTDDYRAKRNEYRRKHRKYTLNENIAGRLRAMVDRILKASGRKKEICTSEQVGYSANQLKERIEFQFMPGMGWDNKSEWHIDHKKPIDAFLKQGVTDPKIINSLCNLRPLWAFDNKSKGGKWPVVIHNSIAKPANDNDLFGVAV